MKKLLLILLCLPILVFSQNKDEQVAVRYSVKYKLPLMKKMLKKTLPDSYMAYYSENAYRVDFTSSFSMLGMKIKIEGLQVENYTELKSLTIARMQAEKDKQAKDTTDYTLEDIFVDTTSKITYTEEEKIILGYKCIGFIVENEQAKIKGFLNAKYSAIGAIIDGRDYGVPMYLEEYNKKEKITEFISVESIQIEPLVKSYYTTTIDAK